MSTDHAATAVAELRQAVDWLAASLLPGTAKPYRTPTLSPDVRAERDRQAWLERLERNAVGPGESPAPFDLDIADLLSEILTAADRLCDEACDTVSRDRLPPAPSAFADPKPYLDTLAELLPQTVTLNPDFAPRVEETCDDLTERAHRLLGLVADGQILNALCPWCGGRDERHPVGGAKTLRVFGQLPAGRNVVNVEQADIEWYIVCHGGNCEPPTSDCSWLHGRPAWSLRNNATFLADRLERAAELDAKVAAIVQAGHVERTA